MAKNKSDQKRRIENVLSALKHDKLAIASLVFLVIIIALSNQYAFSLINPLKIVKNMILKSKLMLQFSM